MRARLWSLVFALALGCASSSATPTKAEVPAAREAAAPRELSPTDEPQLVSVRPHVNDKYFEAGAVEKWTDVLERERREVIAERDDIVAALELKPGMVVADIGAGTGAFMEALSAELGADGKLYAVDIVPEFLEHLETRARTSGLANVVVVEATTTATNLPEGSIDLLFVCDVYHHLEYPSVYLRSLYAALKPDGRMVVVEFDKVPGKTSEGMMKHVRQDKPTLLAEVAAEGFVLEREIDSVKLDENYMLVFRK